MRIRLIRPHTHAGTDYAVGAVLNVSPRDAEWLVAEGVASCQPDAKEHTESDTPATHGDTPQANPPASGLARLLGHLLPTNPEPPDEH